VVLTGKPDSDSVPCGQVPSGFASFTRRLPSLGPSTCNPDVGVVPVVVPVVVDGVFPVAPGTGGQ
jgi:hypothetical protein